ncbi:MAG: HNH endonuclease, partial [Ardenticatenales bacterium]|nr:HNH endonuclease [Ardenticatenales bacterium]
MAVSARVRARVAVAAQHRCGYCQTQEVVSGIPLTLEHLHPSARGGTDDEENLWFSCRLCNEAKGVLAEALDPETGAMVPLFNPRREQWSAHFAWVTGAT